MDIVMNRRNFLSKITTGSLIGVGSLGLLGALRLTYPNISKSKTVLRIGRVNDFPLHTFTLLKDQNIFIYRDRTCVKAVSAICTHLGCVLNRSDSGFRCPCHGSEYNKKGQVLSGPAPRDMSWLKMEFSHDGQLLVLPHQKVTDEIRLEI